MAVICVLLTVLETSRLPFQKMADCPAANPEPLTVRRNAGPRAAVLEGLRLEMLIAACGAKLAVTFRGANIVMD